MRLTETLRNRILRGFVERLWLRDSYRLRLTSDDGRNERRATPIRRSFSVGVSGEQRTCKAFTLLELTVAIGLLAMMILFAGMIFNVSIDTYRVAMANAEIMQKLRVITGQLDADFKGAIWSCPAILVTGIQGTNDANADCIAFFVNGDFQSTLQYGGKTVAGNVASIFYGQAYGVNPNIDPFTGDPKEKILARIQTILTSDPNLPDANSDPRGEYYKGSLSGWEANPPFASVNDWAARPSLDPQSAEGLVMYMAKGVDNFTIEWANGIGGTGGTGGIGGINWQRLPISGTTSISTNALKFTFMLYDSKGIIKNGKTFTHIVYLGN
jgi:type II secretory pathway pseudopilin PulG